MGLGDVEWFLDTRSRAGLCYMPRAFGSLPSLFVFCLGGGVRTKFLAYGVTAEGLPQP